MHRVKLLHWEPPGTSLHGAEVTCCTGHAPCRWAEAASAYEAAGDSDQVVRLCLDKLGEQQRAAALVRRSASPDAAALVARHCLQSSDYRVGALGPYPPAPHGQPCACS
jgi:hypothetical protein